MRRIKNIQTLGPNGIPLDSWSETGVEIHNTNHLWVIHDYNVHKQRLPKGKSLKSPVFSATTCKQYKWYLDLYPNGSEQSKITKKNDFSLYLNLDSTSKNKTALVTFELSILKENKKVELCRYLKLSEFEICADDDNANWGLPEFIDADYKLSSDNKLMIYCEIKIFTTDNTSAVSYSHSADPNVSVPEPRLSEDLGQLFDNEEFSDVVIYVKGKYYKAHKSILSTRSPVFAAMFKHKDMEENQQNKVVISDFDARTVEEMLKFIYTGKSENLNTLADKLLVIAEKYGLEGLKDMSEKLLMNNLSETNAIDLLKFADLHHAVNLRSSALKFIVEKSAQIMRTPGWKKMVVSHPQLVIEVCEAVSIKL